MGTISGYVKESFPSGGLWNAGAGANNSRQNSGQEEKWHKTLSGQWHSLLANQIYTITCKWEPLRKQMLMQWNQLTAHELDEAGPNRHNLAFLVYSKYGVSVPLVENYLRNFERTLPLL